MAKKRARKKGKKSRKTATSKKGHRYKKDKRGKWVRVVAHSRSGPTR